MGNDCCTPKREGDCHEVFHDWWLEDRPALNLFESLEPHDTVEIEGLGGARPEALNVGLDAWDLMPMSETRVVEWFHNHDVGSPANGPVRPMIQFPRSICRRSDVIRGMFVSLFSSWVD